MFNRHPGPRLNEIYPTKPYQGVSPEKATFLFVGLDANYHPAIENHPIFPKILDYHCDGVSFWHQYGVHHPFLLPGYGGEGKFYHQSFARIGFRPEHADLLCFTELLHIPTTGRNKLTIQDLDESHLRRLNSAILDGNAEHIFISSGVARLMRATGVFSWLPARSVIRHGQPGLLFHKPGKTVYQHLHFSVYGKFEKQKTDELVFIRKLLPAAN